MRCNISVRMSFKVALSLLALCAVLRPVLTRQLSQTLITKSFSFQRPEHSEYANMCRWLVHEGSWGTISTLNKDTGAPASGVSSHSDGPKDVPSGRLYFYLTPMDSTAKDLEVDNRCAYTVTESALPGGCGETDPEDPTCAKISVVGHMQRVPTGEEMEMAREAMFSRHPEMADWPTDHSFQFYELHIQQVNLLDWYGGMHEVSKEEYFGADFSRASA